MWRLSGKVHKFRVDLNYMKIVKWIFREDQDLDKKWWHRMVKVVFTIFIISMTLLGVAEFNLTGYSKIGTIYEYINDQPQTVEQIIKNINKGDLVISDNFEPTNGENNSTVFLSKDAICAKNLRDTVSNFHSKGYELYSGGMFNRSKLDLENFLKYLETKNIQCIIPTFYTAYDGGKVPMIQVFGSDDHNTRNVYFYSPNEIKTIWYFIFGTYFSDSIYIYSGIWFYILIPALVLVLIYYKFIIYIVFGSKKK